MTACFPGDTQEKPGPVPEGVYWDGSRFRWAEGDYIVDDDFHAKWAGRSPEFPTSASEERACAAEKAKAQAEGGSDQPVPTHARAGEKSAAEASAERLMDAKRRSGFGSEPGMGGIDIGEMHVGPIFGGAMDAQTEADRLKALGEALSREHVLRAPNPEKRIKGTRTLEAVLCGDEGRECFEAATSGRKLRLDCGGRAYVCIGAEWHQPYKFSFGFVEQCAKCDGEGKLNGPDGIVPCECQKEASK